MRKPAWLRTFRRAPETRVDPAPLILTRIAEAIEGRALEVLRGRASASHEPPIRTTLRHEESPAQTWHSDIGDGVDVWCTIGDVAARALLEIVLGGPGASNPTALERGIVRETIDRVLTSTGRLWEERGGPKPANVSGWVCRLKVTSGRGCCADLALYAPAFADPPAPFSQSVDLRNVPVNLSAALTSINYRVNAIAAWKGGTIVPLRGGADARIGLFSGPSLIAEGRLGTVNGRRAIRIERIEAEPRP